MKKKILGTLAFLVVVLGIVYLMGVFDAGKPDEKDLEELEKSNVEMDKVLKDAENIEMPEGFEDTTEIDLGLDEEEFDPEAML